MLEHLGDQELMFPGHFHESAANLLALMPGDLCTVLCESVEKENAEWEVVICLR